MKKIKVLIADDHTLVRDGIRSLLALVADVEVVGEATNGREALDKVKRLGPDVVLMDLAMPVMSGLEATRRIHREAPGTKVLALMQCYAGDPAEGEAVLAPIRGFGQPIGDAVSPMRYAEAQQILDQTYEKGLRNYWKSSNFKQLLDVTIDKLVAIAGTMPTPESDVLICQLGGAIADIASDASAWVTGRMMSETPRACMWTTTPSCTTSMRG